MPLLTNKVAVIYGAAGAIGAAVSKTLASHGAKVFLTSHRLASIEALAKDIPNAMAAQVDATNEREINAHFQSVLAQAGRVDISFNAVGFSTENVIGVPLLDLEEERFTGPITAYARSYFLTARIAGRHMVQRKSGVIMTVSALPARIGTRLNGGYGAAMAAKEQLTRDLSFELSPHGVRVVTLRPHGLPETNTMRELFRLKPMGLTYEQFTAHLAGMTHARRVMKVEEVANMAALLASDMASGATGTIANLTMGNLDD